MLHIHGGTILLDRIRAAGIPGDTLSWNEVLCQGPTPAGLSASEWRWVRAEFLDRHGEKDGESALAALVRQDEALAAVDSQDEIVLWFGPELFCQSIMLFMLDFFAKQPARRAELSLICIGDYPGVEDQHSCTVGFLNADQLRDVFAARAPVTPAQFAYASQAWAAYCAPDPEALAILPPGADSGLPFVKPALDRHLQEFPDRAGLSLSERWILEAIAAGAESLQEIWGATQARETRRWRTDLMLLSAIQRLADGAAPLVAIAGTLAYRPQKKQIRLTENGRRVLAGAIDWMAINGLDHWLGGVHLRGPECPRRESPAHPTGNPTNN